jgi:hypothetical protein
MQYMLMVFADSSRFAKMSKADQEQGMAAYTSYTKALREAGVHVGSNRLGPASSATTVRVANGKSQILNGPYADSKEQFGGYFLIDVPDLDEALSWAARCPGASHGAVEVRPLWS